MTYERRSHYEFGDPVFEQIAKEEHTDHVKAKARGLRLRDLAQAIASGLTARGILPGEQMPAARILIFGVLADALYGNHAIDIPDLREDER